MVCTATSSSLPPPRPLGRLPGLSGQASGSISPRAGKLGSGSSGWLARRWLACAWALLPLGTARTAGVGVAVDPSIEVALAHPWNGVEAATVDGEGRLILVGGFAAVDGLPRAGAARLNRDGTLDPTYSGPTRASRVGDTELAQPGWARRLVVAIGKAGEVYVGGGNDSRLGPRDGVVFGLGQLGGFDGPPGLPPTDLDGPITAMAVQEDGQLIVAGPFSRVRTATRGGIARFTASGALDPAFGVATALRGGDRWEVSALLPLEDGALLVGGSFTEAAGQAVPALLRLSPDASPDSRFQVSFEPMAEGAPVALQAIARQPDGRLLVGGRFKSVNGVTRPGLARLMADGTLDGSFQAEIAETSAVDWIQVATDGKVIIGAARLDSPPVGNPMLVRASDGAMASVGRLNADGSIDSTFHWGHMVTSFGDVIPPRLVADARLRDDGTLILAGPFRLGYDSPLYGVVRFDAAGNVEPGFRPVPGYHGTVTSAVRTGSGQWYLGGSFVAVNGVPRMSLVRLRADGGVDEGFDAELGEANSGFGAFPAQVHRLILEPDGRLLVAGTFPQAGGEWVRGLVRLRDDGSADPAFRPLFGQLGEMGGPSWVTTSVTMLERLDDGSLYVGGLFEQANGVPRPGLARLRADGSLDPRFDPSGTIGETAAGFPGAMGVGADGRLIVVTQTYVNGRLRIGLLRLQPDGTPDPGFDPGRAFDNREVSVARIIVQQDQRILLAGSFSTFGGLVRRGLVRLEANGVVDLTFAPGAGATAEPAGGALEARSVHALALQADGSLLVGGDFGAFGGVRRAGLALLDSRGAVRADFDAAIERPLGSEGAVNVNLLEWHDDGSLLIGGRFGAVAGQPQMGLSQIYVAPHGVRPALAIRSRHGGWILRLRGEPNRAYRFQTSADLRTWEDLGEGVLRAETPELELTIPEGTTAPAGFYRAVVKNP